MLWYTFARVDVSDMAHVIDVFECSKNRILGNGEI